VFARADAALSAAKDAAAAGSDAVEAAAAT
jgi:hypothetical protein